MLWGRRVHLKPGWHRDPTGRHQYREYDGERWTAHVSDRGRVSHDPVDSAIVEASTRDRKVRRRLYVQH